VRGEEGEERDDQAGEGRVR